MVYEGMLCWLLFTSTESSSCMTMCGASIACTGFADAYVDIVSQQIVINNIV